MSVNLSAALNSKIDFGDVPEIGGATELSIALMVEIIGIDGGKVRLLHKHAALEIAITGTNLYFSINSSPLFGRKTTGLNLVAGTFFRFVVTWQGGAAADKAVKFYVGGKDEPNIAHVGSTVQAAVPDNTNVLMIGRYDEIGADPINGPVSEFAVWNRVVSPSFAKGYGYGRSPRHHREGGILYTSLFSPQRMFDEWRGYHGVSAQSGAFRVDKRAHPRVFHPPPFRRLSPPFIVPPHTSPPRVDDGTVSIRETEDASVSVRETDDASVSLRETEDATV